MDSTYLTLCQRASDLLKSHPGYRVLILLAGPPGSGKSTVARNVADLLNLQHRKQLSSISTAACHPPIAQYNSSIANYSTAKITEKLSSNNKDGLPQKKQCSNSQVQIIGQAPENSITLMVPSLDDNANASEFAQVVPMDGFHLPRRVLSQFKDPVTAFARRGAPFTFDAPMVAILANLLRSTCDVIVSDICPDPIFTNEGISLDPQFHNHDAETSSMTSSSRQSAHSSLFEFDNDQASVESFDDSDNEEDYNNIWKLRHGRTTMIPDIVIPSFDHAEKDPRANGITIKAATKVVILEGLYVLLDLPYWMDISGDQQHSGVESWKINLDESSARTRVAKRHLQAGIVDNLQDGEARYDANDCINGRLVDRQSKAADFVVCSKNE
ncbi:Yfh7 protein [Saccharomycopsis crataegensis]|uniref:Yfh7 protein n=1 Tax=Saccharomycopsis crataegensis TaxID=43959 RepID=A0AAV5QKA4_9ASCO|nr:Yfh7 protein [Saccharomycopsis crataegensis]